MCAGAAGTARPLGPVCFYPKRLFEMAADVPFPALTTGDDSIVTRQRRRRTALEFNCVEYALDDCNLPLVARASIHFK